MCQVVRREENEPPCVCLKFQVGGIMPTKEGGAHPRHIGGIYVYVLGGERERRGERETGENT